MNDDEKTDEATIANLTGVQMPIGGDDEEPPGVREAVRSLVSELIRKKGGNYVLYSPNRGKKHPPKQVGEFPTKTAARKAELARFPPKDAEKLKRVRREIDRLMKDPDKRNEKDKAASKTKPQKKTGAPQSAPTKKKRESVEQIASSILQNLTEALFNEEDSDSSQWDERISSMPSSAVESDKKLQSLQKTIEKRTLATLQGCIKEISRVLRGIKGKVKAGDPKKDEQRQKTYVPFTVDIDGTTVGPFYVFVDGGTPQLEISGEAKSSLSKLDPKVAKALRTELISCKEDSFPNMIDVHDAIENRDGYLTKVESSMDDYIADLSALQLTVLKSLLAQKYRGKKR